MSKAKSKSEIQTGDHIVVEDHSTDSEKKILIGRVTDKNGHGILETSLPFDSYQPHHEITVVKGENFNMVSDPEAENFIGNFQRSLYTEYMSFEWLPSGGMQIQGE